MKGLTDRIALAGTYLRCRFHEQMKDPIGSTEFFPVIGLIILVVVVVILAIIFFPQSINPQT